MLPFCANILSSSEAVSSTWKSTQGISTFCGKVQRGGNTTQGENAQSKEIVSPFFLHSLGCLLPCYFFSFLSLHPPGTTSYLTHSLPFSLLLHPFFFLFFILFPQYPCSILSLRFYALCFPSQVLFSFLASSPSLFSLLNQVTKSLGA